MRIKIIILMALFFSSCTGRNQSQNQIPNPEKAIESENILSETFKRGGEDYLVKLYHEILRTDTTFQNLENLFQQVAGSQEDSLQTFTDYQTKNTEYYKTADRYASNIQDSILKQHIYKLITSSDTLFKQKMQMHTAFAKQIQKQNLYLHDLHQALMIYSTIPLIQQYQLQNIPQINSLKSFLTDQKELSQKLETLIEK